MSMYKWTANMVTLVAFLSQGILIVFWKLVSKRIDGVFIAVNILDTVTNYGQVGYELFLTCYEYLHNNVECLAGFLPIHGLWV